MVAVHGFQETDINVTRNPFYGQRLNNMPNRPSGAHFFFGSAMELCL